MQSEHYPFQGDEAGLFFEFLSVSPTKTIRKEVHFMLMNQEINLYNLALVDMLSSGKKCDVTVSDNGDLDKVISTIACCIGTFFKNNPFASIYIEGSTKSRTRLYRIIFSRELAQIEKKYELYGRIGLRIEPFTPNTDYNLYILKLKTWS